MKIYVNGKEKKVKASRLVEVLASLKYDHGKIIVSVNGNAVGRDKYSETNLSDGDKIEIFSFVGGG